MIEKPSISYGLQFAILLGLLGVSIIIMGIVVAILGSVLMDIPLMQVSEAMNKSEYAGTAGVLNTIVSFFAFFVPVLILAKIVSRHPFKQMGFNTTLNAKQVLLVLGMTFAGMLLSGALAELNEQIPLPAYWYEKAKNLEETYRKAMMAMATMHSVSEYLAALLIMAVFPAIFEETLFRGGFQQILIGATKSKWAGIIITSIFFSAIHFSYFGFLPRVGLGIVLGLIFYHGKNIWLNILLHFFNNAFVVTKLYILSRQGKSIEKAMDESSSPWWGLVAIALLLFIFRAFNKQSAKLLAAKEIVATADNTIG